VQESKGAGRFSTIGAERGGVGGRRGREHRGFGFVAILLLALAYVALVQGPGWNQTSHYALVRALAAGTTVIDRSRFQTGEWYPTGDVSTYRGHLYSNKAPGLAFVTLPAYEALRAAGGAVPRADASGQLWFLGLWAVVLPAALLLLLVRRVANELEPGYGTAAAVILGLATLVLPFATLFFSHVFSALLGFAAFALLVYERRGRPRLEYVAAAGVLAGCAVTTEFPNAIVAAILAVAVVARPGRRVVRAAYFVGGAYLGLLPVLVYNQWAFKSPFHLSYQSTVGFGPSSSLFLGTPSLRRLTEVLFAPTGMLRTTPVIALGGVGVVLLFRRGRRFEATVIGAVVLGFLLFEAAYVSAFGGSSPGPRQLIPILPFLAIAFAAAFRRMPLTTLALAAISAVEMISATVAHPLMYSQENANWFHQLNRGDLSGTALGFITGPSLDPKHWWSSHWYELLLFFLPIALALGLAIGERPRLMLQRVDAVRAGTAVLGWLVVQREAPSLLHSDRFGGVWAPVAVLSLAVAISLASAFVPSLVTAQRAQPPSTGGAPLRPRR
jgi:hypothetical protein